MQRVAAELPRLGYRPALDGIRAGAILAVFAFHSGTPLHGAFIGVDIFFVLSGFLITTLLFQEWQTTNSIAVGDFYRRRAARLLPALFVTIAVVAVIYAVYPHFNGLHADAGFAGIALAVIFYSSNWVIALSQGDIHFGLLAHTWSLAIEEQFYLLWPPLLYVCLRRRFAPLRLLILTVTLAVGSAVVRAILWNVERGGNVYFRSDARADGLLLGCALATVYASPYGRRLLRRLLGHVVAGLAAVAILFLFAIETDSLDPRLYNGGLLVVAICSAALIAHVVTAQNSLLSKLLAAGPLVWIGARSYGMYLFHWPIFVTINATSIGERPGRFVAPLEVALTIVAAAASYRWIETPFLRRHRLRGAPPHVQRAESVTPPG